MKRKDLFYGRFESPGACAIYSRSISRSACHMSRDQCQVQMKLTYFSLCFLQFLDDTQTAIQ